MILLLAYLLTIVVFEIFTVDFEANKCVYIYLLICELLPLIYILHTSKRAAVSMCMINFASAEINILE